MCNHENYSQATAADWEAVCADCGATLRGQLVSYDDGDYIREATVEEYRESLRAAEYDGCVGVIMVDGQRCYVTD